MPHSRRLRSTTSVLAAIAAVVGLTLTTPGSRPGQGRRRSGRRDDAPDGRARPEGRPGPEARTGALHQRALQPRAAGLPQKHLARCFSVVRTALDHQISPGRRPATDGARPGRHPGRLQPARTRRTARSSGSSTRSATRTPRPTSRQFRSVLRTAAVHGRQRLPADRQPGRRHQSAAPDDPGWGLETSLDLDAVSAACPNCYDRARPGRRQLPRQPRHRRGHRGLAGRQVRLQLLRRARRGPRRVRLRPLLRPPGVAVTASTGDLGNVTNWPATSPKVVAVGGTTLTSDTLTARLDRVRLGRRRQRLLAVRAEAGLPAGPRHPAATTGRSPTSPRTPTPTPAWPSTTPSARAAGSRSVAPACRPR